MLDNIHFFLIGISIFSSFLRSIIEKLFFYFLTMTKQIVSYYHFQKKKNLFFFFLSFPSFRELTLFVVLVEDGVDCEDSGLLHSTYYCMVKKEWLRAASAVILSFASIVSICSSKLIATFEIF